MIMRITWRLASAQPLDLESRDKIRGRTGFKHGRASNDQTDEPHQQEHRAYGIGGSHPHEWYGGTMTEDQDTTNRAFVFDIIDVQMVQRVYKAILSKGSFDRTHDNEQALAKFLVRCLQGGMKDEESLRLVGENAAIIKWSKSQELMAWPIRSSLAED